MALTRLSKQHVLKLHQRHHGITPASLNPWSVEHHLEIEQWAHTRTRQYLQYESQRRQQLEFHCERLQQHSRTLGRAYVRCNERLAQTDTALYHCNQSLIQCNEALVACDKERIGVLVNAESKRQQLDTMQRALHDHANPGARLTLDILAAKDQQIRVLRRRLLCHNRNRATSADDATGSNVASTAFDDDVGLPSVESQTV
ncbi:hypothetical protein LTR66_005158 [Elasticomyces elasticus]|nr:hypothetical protein LTR66_005158 [Elasticomyces elasticus]